MKYLVTGGAGFIGSHVTEHLLARGETVVGIDNFDPFYPSTLKRQNLKQITSHPNFSLIELDIRDQEAVARLLAEYRPQLQAYGRSAAALFPGCEVRLSLYSTVVAQLAEIEPAT